MMLLGVTLNRDLHAATQEWCVGCGGNAENEAWGMLRWPVLKASKTPRK